jgi:hypothetical protein
MVHLTFYPKRNKEQILIKLFRFTYNNKIKANLGYYVRFIYIYNKFWIYVITEITKELKRL